MRDLDAFMWRSTLSWKELVGIATQVIEVWNTATRFETRIDQRERQWTARHQSVAQPFITLSEDSLRGSIPREGNPLAMLLLIGMSHARHGCIDVTFANGKQLDLLRFDPADLTTLLPQATHPAHRKLAELAVSIHETTDGS